MSRTAPHLLSGVQVVAASTEIPVMNGAPSRRIKLLPMGPIAMRDGRGPYRVRDQAHAAQIVAATRAFFGSADMPGDYDHQMLHAVAPGIGGRAEASAWVKPAKLTAEADGIYANDVAWTAAASAALVSRQYRYISPLFMARAPQDGGDVLHLKNFALVNIGAIDMPAIAASVCLGGAYIGAATIAAAIGVQRDAGIAEIAAAVGAMEGTKLLATFGQLSDVERDVCRVLGRSEAEFLVAKTIEQIAASIGDGRLDGTPGPLTQLERDVCRANHVSEADFLAAKAAQDS